MLSFGAILLFGLGANAEAGWLYVIGASLVGVAVAGVAIPALSLRKLQVQRFVPRSAVAGEPINVELVVANGSRSKRRLLFGYDEFIFKTDLVIPTLLPNGSVTLPYQVVSARRGVFSEAPVVLKTGAPFGAAIAGKRFEVSSELIVHPTWVPLRSFPLLEAASTPNESWHERPRRGGGMDFYGLREYRSGDSLRQVHWRSSAKGGKLLVREFEEQPSSRLTIVLDTSASVGEEPVTTLEDAISVAASLVMYAIDSGHPVQLFADDINGTRHLFEPNKAQALDWLSSIEAVGRRGLVRQATDAVSEIFRRSTNVFIFPTTGMNTSEAPAASAVLQQQGARVIAVAVSARTYDEKDKRVASPASEDDLIARLASSRSIVYKVENNKEITECLRLPLSA